MSDAICGPSNALQNFQKHTSVDRTLQQDRLTNRQSPAQGFRSQNTRDGILDPEFAAFEANLGGPALPNVQHPAHFGAPAQLPGASPNLNWASDFQNLHISAPAAPQIHTPPVAQGGWQNEFLNQQQPQHHAPAHHAPAYAAQNHGYQPGFTPSYSMYNNSMSFQQPQQNISTQQQAQPQQFDESAFEAAFAQARADLDTQGAEETTTTKTENLEKMKDPEPSTIEATHEDMRIGSDLIPQTEQEDPQNKTHDADALAQTAGQLLDSVRHDQSEKFQQSNFLALMRRIRDREVQVEGEEFRETAQSLHPGGQYYPGKNPSRESVVPPDSTNNASNLAYQPGSALEDESPRLGTNPVDSNSGDNNALYEGWVNGQGLVDRRAPTFCFRGDYDFFTW